MLVPQQKKSPAPPPSPPPPSLTVHGYHGNIWGVGGLAHSKKASGGRWASGASGHGTWRGAPESFGSENAPRLRHMTRLVAWLESKSAPLISAYNMSVLLELRAMHLHSQNILTHDRL